MAKFATHLIILLQSVIALSVEAQKHQGFVSRYVNHLVNDTSDITKPQFLIYPTVGYSPETSWEFGLSSVFVFYANRDTTNRLSEINAFTFITLEKQYGLWLDHALYFQDNAWFSLGRMRFQSFPLLYHGIGPRSSVEHLAQVNANLINVRERVLRKVVRNLYSGFEIDYQQLSSVEFIPHENDFTEFPVGSSGSSNLGIGAGVLYDNRHNILNVRHGLFSELAFLRYDKAWGSDYSFTTILSDTRFYRPVNKRDVIAFQLIGQFTLGQPPFNQLALMGGETIMRGYYLGRYRDNNLLAAQAEYRMLPLPWTFTKRWGAAFFAGTGTVFNHVNQFSPKTLVWAAGTGVRFFLFPKKDIYTRFDVAFTREGTGIYLFIGEAF